jgi:hypothetical protein
LVAIFKVVFTEELAFGVTVAGLNHVLDATYRGGRFKADTDTGWLKPFKLWIVIV